MRGAALGALGLVACEREEAVVAPPALPQAPVAQAEAPREVEPSRLPSGQHAKPRAANEEPKHEAKRASKEPAAPSPKRESKGERPAGWGAAYVPPPLPDVVTAPAPVAPKPTPAPAPPPPAPVPAKPKTRVTVPRTDHVHVELPAGLQSDLDADPRMQPWVEKAITIMDNCHAKERSNTGTVEAALVMHENARPGAEARALPSSLRGVAACATMALMRTKVPLFTGREGTRYTVRIVFE